MKHEYRMYGWQGSHFVGKLRGYLNYKGLDYRKKTFGPMTCWCAFRVQLESP